MEQHVAWEPQPKQHILISCPIEDVFFGGQRGGGKTDGLLGDFLSHQALYPEHARGIFFRRSYPELEEVEARAQAIFPATGGIWRAAKRTWTWPAGASLRMRFFEKEADHTHFQGHQYTWQAWDEITNWPTSDGIDKLRATLRSSKGVPCYVRCSGNPGGVGHNWVKARYVDPAPPMTPFAATVTVGEDTVTVKRVYIPSSLDDNYILRQNDPGYWQRIVLAAGGREDILKAWRYGLWDIVAGGYFDDIWREAAHVLPPFDIPPSWGIRRAFDWGSAAPFAVLWVAHSDGDSPAGAQKRVYPKGTRFVIGEYYGWNGKPNEGLRLTNSEIARNIHEREVAAPWGARVRPGPADTQIFDVTNGTSIADEMALHGITWTAAQKGPGSRRQGWQGIRSKLLASQSWPLEEPGLFVFENCRQFLRTFPTLPRDTTDAEDVDSAVEDHLADCLRYECSMPFIWQAGRLKLQGY